LKNEFLEPTYRKTIQQQNKPRRGEMIIEKQNNNKANPEGVK
jgi:hypothetical protein